MTELISSKNKLLPDVFGDGGYDFYSYAVLGEFEHIEIIDKRNKFRELAHNTEILTLNGHLDFVENLKNRNDKIYFLVKNRGGKGIFSINLQNIDVISKECEWGFFKIDKCDSRDVLSCFLKYLFKNSDMEKVFGYVKNDNEKSHLIHLDLGFDEIKSKKMDGGTVYSLSENNLKEVDNAAFG